MKNTSSTLNKIHKEIFPAIGLQVENNNSITYIENDEKKFITCNKKPLFINNDLKSKDNHILLNLYSDNINCTYHVLEKHILATFSSKINVLFKYLIKFAINTDLSNKENKEIHPFILELYKNDFRKETTNEENILEKWSKIYTIINKQASQNILMEFSLKPKFVIIDKPRDLNEKECSNKSEDGVKYASLHQVINITFPLYELLKNIEDNTLFGITLEKEDIKLFKVIYEYLFEDIDKENAYRYPKNELLNDVLKDTSAIVYDEPTHLSLPLILLKTFINTSNYIDLLLRKFTFINKIDMENEMFNLSITVDEVNKLEEDGPGLSVYDDNIDLIKEKKNSKSIDIKSLNKQLNKECIREKRLIIENNTKKNYQKTRYLNYQNIQSRAFQRVQPSIVDNSMFLKTGVVLDPCEVTFDETIPYAERLKHTYVLGATGAGKSELIKTLMYSDIQKNESSILLLDPHGDLAFDIAKMIEDKDRLIYIDPYLSKKKIPTINPFEIKNKDEETISIMTQELVSAFETGLGLEWSHNMEAVLSPCISTLLRKGDSDVYELQRFMDNDNNKDLIELGRKSPIKGHRNFFNNQFKKDKLIVTKDAIAIKLQTLLNDPIFANLITGENTIDLENEINTKGKIIIFKLSKGKMKSTLSLYSKLIMATIQGIILRRQNIPAHLRLDTHLYLDEFQNFIGSTIEDILTESRKYKLFVILAHQTISQIDKKIKGIVLSNTNIKIIGKSSHDDLRIMGKEIQTDISKLETLGQGEFFLKVGTKDTIKIKNTDRFVNNKITLDDEKWGKNCDYQLKYYYKDINDEDDQEELVASKYLTPLMNEF